MPVYDNVETMSYYPHPEQKARKIFEGMTFESILDVGAGHGGIFDLDRWESDPRVRRKVACDIHWIRDLPPTWEKHLGVDVTKLDEFYNPGSFDFVQCVETLEHVPDNDLALKQLVKVAKKAVFLTSADELHHIGPEQEAIEKINKYQAFVKQPSVETMKRLGFEVRVEETIRRQLIAWLIK